MHIRESNNNELGAIQTLHAETFGEPEGEAIAELVGNLLNDQSASSSLSLVIEEDNKIIGHVIFSPVTIEGSDNLPAFILSPLAIAKTHQKKGLGTQLIQKGLDELKARGADVVFVLGDPNYYERTGFRAGHKVAAPYELPYPEAWMALELKAGVLSRLDGVARCVAPLMPREYW